VNLLPLLLAPLLAAGAEPLIRVDGISVSGEAISARAAALRAAGKSFTAERLVDALLEEAILVAEARRKGLDRDPDVRDALELESARVLAEAFAQGPLAASVKPTEAELQALLHQGTDTVRLEMVAVATEAEALQVKARLEAGGEFALEAIRSLDTKSGRNKGLTGPHTRMELAPAMAKQAFEAPIGKLFGPVPLNAGFAVARVVERRIADAETMKARRPALEQFARQQGLAAARKHYVEMVRAKEKAIVDVAFIESLGKRTDATPEEREHEFAKVGGESLRYRILLPRVRAVGGGHLQGPTVKLKLAWTVVDDRLLAKAARGAGLASAPQVAAALTATENQILASNMANRIVLSLPSKASPAERNDALRKRVEALRRELSIQLDRKAAIAAAEKPR